MKSNKLLLSLDKSSWAMIYFVAAVSPFLSLFAPLGLSPAFILAALFPVISSIAFRRGVWNVIFKFSVYKVIIAFLILGALSAIWSVEPNESLSMCSRLLLLFIGLISLLEFVKQADIKQKNIICKTLSVGFVFALAAANLEIISDGILSKFFRSFKGEEYNYELTDLNRGSSYLVIIFWGVLAWLVVRSKNLFAIIVTALTLFTVLRMESQSSSMALIVSLAVFPIILFLGKNALKAMMVIAVFAVITVAAVAHKMQPDILFKTLPNIPNSASEYRLYIWDYTAKRAMENPILGWGLNSARSIPVGESEFVLGGRHPLPLHPHNNVLQVWLELGVVGLAFFIAFLVAQIHAIINMRYSILNTHCRASFDINGKQKIMHIVYQNLPVSMFFGLFSTYFAIGETGYGIWQNWWLSGGLLSLVFVHCAFSTHKQ